MFGKLFGKKDVDPLAEAPSIMGLRIGGSFELDPLLLKLTENELVIKGADTTHIIKAAGVVDLDGTWIYRFYSDDDGFIQVVAEGGQTDECVVDVKLFYFYDTLDVASQDAWDKLLNEQIGAPKLHFRRPHL